MAKLSSPAMACFINRKPAQQKQLVCQGCNCCAMTNESSGQKQKGCFRKASCCSTWPLSRKARGLLRRSLENMLSSNWKKLQEARKQASVSQSRPDGRFIKAKDQGNSNRWPFYQGLKRAICRLSSQFHRRPNGQTSRFPAKLLAGPMAVLSRPN